MSKGYTWSIDEQVWLVCLKNSANRGRKAPPLDLLNFIREGNKFLVAGHKEPDGDCLGSQLALASLLQRMGKEAILCSAGPFRRSEVKPFEHLFCAEPDGSDARVIIVDCASLDRCGALEPFLKNLPLAVIDHHKTGNPRLPDKDQKAIFYIDSNAASTTLMIMRIIEALGLDMCREEAEYIFFGLSTDTGFFRHIDSSGSEIFDDAAALIRSGANPRETFQAVYGGKSLNSRILLGHALLRVESFYDGQLVLSSEEYEETCTYGKEGRDSDSLYRLLLSVSGVESVVIIRQETPDNCTVGLRSNSWVDVGNIAETLGGGGHKNAAGISITGTIAELKLKIINAFGNIF